MAIQTACFYNWSGSTLPSDQTAPRDLSISKILVNGSASFGRFTSESLAWEKLSYFRHNKSQEELQDFFSAGNVAQKKAYFEAYYQRLRAMRALRAGKKGAPLCCPCQHEDDAEEVSWGIFQVRENDKQKGDSSGSNDEASVMDKHSIPLSITEQEHSLKESIIKCASLNNAECEDFQKQRISSNVVDCIFSQIENSVEESYLKHIYSNNADCEALQKDRISSDAVERSSGQIEHSMKESCLKYSSGNNADCEQCSGPVKKTAAVQQDKGTAITVRSKLKLRSRTSKCAPKLFDSPKSSTLCKLITNRKDNSSLTKKTTPKAGNCRNSNTVPSPGAASKQRPGTDTQHTSFIVSKLLPCSSSNTSQSRENLMMEVLQNKQSRKSSAEAHSPKGTVSLRSKSKMDSNTSKDAVKLSDKHKSSLPKAITAEIYNRLLSKKMTSKAEKETSPNVISSRRNVSTVHSGINTRQTSHIADKSLSSCSVSSGQNSNSASEVLAHKKRKELPLPTRSQQLNLKATEDAARLQNRASNNKRNCDGKKFSRLCAHCTGIEDQEAKGKGTKLTSRNLSAQEYSSRNTDFIKRIAKKEIERTRTDGQRNSKPASFLSSVYKTLKSKQEKRADPQLYSSPKAASTLGVQKTPKPERTRGPQAARETRDRKDMKELKKPVWR